ncbi:MAG: hypothetical protein M3N46_11880 [Actinomycetota bacterium]|nr:hypothetical protein [Actinomycetota bacterium]
MSPAGAYEAIRTALTDSHTGWEEVLADFDSANRSFAQGVVSSLVALTGGDFEYLQSNLVGSGRTHAASVFVFTRTRIVAVEAVQAQPRVISSVHPRSAVRSMSVHDLEADYREHGRGLTDVRFNVVVEGRSRGLLLAVHKPTTRLDAQPQQRARLLALFQSLLVHVDDMNVR